jgi:hypothetical protein
MIESIPHADATDIAEQDRSVDDDLDEGGYRPSELRDDFNADAADVLEQQLAVLSDDDERPHEG